MVSACANIKALYGQLSTESYPEAFLVTEMESFERIVNGFKPSTIFTRKLHHRSFAGF